MMRTREGSASDVSSPVGSRSSSSVDSPGTIDNGGDIVMSPISPLGVNTFGSPFSYDSEVSSPHESILSPVVREHAQFGAEGGDLLAIVKAETDTSVIATSSSSVIATTSTSATPPRRRGRPRKDQSKHKALETIDEKTESKKAKGRTKTGCFTCRARKKKCDEGKPVCAGCIKNGVICEGYPEVKQWKSGKDRQADKLKLQKWRQAGPFVLPNTFPWIKDELDSRLFSHFGGFTAILSLNKDQSNPFQEILIPMAFAHEGLMHMLLSVSGSHIRQTVPSDRNDTLDSRIELHYQLGYKTLTDAPSSSKAALDAPRLAIATLNCVQNVVNGRVGSEWFSDLNTLKQGMDDAVMNPKGLDTAFRGFLTEFFIYHKTASMITQRAPFEFDFWSLPGFVDASVSAFLGVCDTIVMTIAKTRMIRDRIRALQSRYLPSRQRGPNHLVLQDPRINTGNAGSNDFQELGDDGDIDMENNDSTNMRFISPASNAGNATPTFPVVDYEVIQEAVQVDNYLSNCSCSHPIGDEMWLCWQVYRVAAWLYMYRTVYNSAPSSALDETFQRALDCLEDISPDSGCQSVLLTPVFMMGCSAFKEEHRQAVLRAMETIENYSGLGNIKHARAIVGRIWQLMDSEDERDREHSWDWEGVMEEMGLDLLIT